MLNSEMCVSHTRFLDRGVGVENSEEQPTFLLNTMIRTLVR